MSKIRIVTKTLIAFFMINLLFSVALFADIDSNRISDPQKEDTKKYQKVYNLVLEKKWKEAMKAVRTFAKDFPGSVYIDDVHYWDTYAFEKLGATYEKAVEKYQQFLSKYPRSNWADDAKSSLINLASKLSKEGLKKYSAIIESIKESQESSIKLQALYALADSEDPKSLDTIITLFDKSKDNKFKSRILHLLTDFDESPKAFKKLKDIILNEKDTDLKRRALYALTDFDKKDKEILNMYTKILNSDNDVKI